MVPASRLVPLGLEDLESLCQKPWLFEHVELGSEVALRDAAAVMLQELSGSGVCSTSYDNFAAGVDCSIPSR